ncbi:molybdopterin molybdotransferase MoeA [Methanococcus voltae]|uniref:Molybdenum cofactor synthesis domain protein n=1 Tax=Methanococcus voltae (strain ATCC BAA-1334 / A3) TaxID=456320 RepID=D7DTE9_METV3|nr:molybdopterin molybdotransferase MoeA [Methanococcus voltae]MCS3901261.1 molybdopterin molybdotransferase [Methanococcus voltae]
MISITELNKILQSKFQNNKTEKINLNDAFSRVIAEDLYSNIAVPPYNKSNMDGFAVSEKLDKYVLIDEVHAGDNRDLSIRNNECTWVATGAKLPEGTNYIIPIEYLGIETEEMVNYIKNNGNTIILNLNEEENHILRNSYLPNNPFEENHIVKKGIDIEEGQLLLKKGTKINERNVGLLASSGVNELNVYSLPKVGIISTGDELKLINDVNSKTIGNMVKKAGCEPKFLGVSKDDFAELRNIVKTALNEYDVVITSGGVSRGKKDFTKRVIEDLGSVLMHRAKIKPGMPILLGEAIDENNICKPLICMPGNVTSCVIIAQVVVYPFLKSLMHENLNKNIRQFKISEELYSQFDRTIYMPVKIENGVAYPTFEGSNMIKSVAYAEGLVEITDDKKYDKDELVDVWMF